MSNDKECLMSQTLHMDLVSRTLDVKCLKLNLDHCNRVINCKGIFLVVFSGISFSVFVKVLLGTKGNKYGETFSIT